MTDRLQLQRYELKYWLDEAQALRVRQFVQGYLTPDEFSARQPDLSYPTLSLYLDSKGLDTYWHTINGNKNRYKLRLRYYDGRPHTPVFFEIKRRENNVILKHRAGVKKSAVRALLDGQLPAREHLLNPDDGQALVALQKFSHHLHHLRAAPKMHIAYRREAYENPGDNGVRVTFDRRVESSPHHHETLVERHAGPHIVFGPKVVMELKFNGRFPNWFRDLVQTFNCVQEGAAKYATGIFEKGEQWALRPHSPKRILEEFMSAEQFPGLFENSYAAFA